MAARVVYIARNDGTDTRVSKECNSLLEAGYDVHYVGWRTSRDQRRPDPMPDVPKHIYSIPFRLSRVGKAVSIPGFAIHIARVIRRLQPEIVHTVNEDLGCIAFLFKKINRFRLVCDIFDSIDHVWGAKAFPFGTMARGMTWVAHRFSDALIVTDDTRKGELNIRKGNVKVVSNFPLNIQIDNYEFGSEDDGPIRLYVAGTLTRARGLETVLDLLEERDDLEICSAGWVYDDTAQRFIAHPRVRFKGVLTPEESLREAAKCHSILALYEPKNKNQILASPNKIYDALCVGRPVIINREAKISEWVQDQALGYLVSYGNLDDLAHAVDQLKRDLPSLAELSTRLRTMYETRYNWRVAERDLLDMYAWLRAPRTEPIPTWR